MRAMQMPPARMIEAQADLAKRIEKNEGFIQFALEMVSQALEMKGLRDLASNPTKTRTAATLMSLMHQSAAHARCYHVSPDMCALIEHAAAGLDESDLAEFAGLAPANYGLVRFDGEGLTVLDPRGEVMKMNWLLWGDCAFVTGDPGQSRHDERLTDEGVFVVDKDLAYEEERVVRRDDQRITAEGFSVWEFNDRIDNPDGISQTINETIPKRALDQTMGRWNILGNHVVQVGTPVGPNLLHATGEQRARIIAEGDTPRPATNTLRLLHAFWLLLQQPIAEEDVARLTGPARKAAKANGVKRASLDTEVSVIQIRRAARQAKPEPAVDAKRHVEWQGQWIVNGFWRWQAFGPGRKERKRIWVDGFVKGPADKPLINRKRVYSVRP